MTGGQRGALRLALAAALLRTGASWSWGGSGASASPGGASSLRGGLVEEVLSVRPLIIQWKNFASAEECQGLLDLIERCRKSDWPECNEVRSKLNAKAKTMTASGKRQWRNSTSYQLTLAGDVDPAVDGLLRRAHMLARHPITYGEGVQVASYHPGDYYEFHHDSLNRRATFLLYANDIPEGDGGETLFPLIRAPGVPEDREPPLPPAVTGRPREHLDFKVERMEDMAPYCASDYYLKIRPEAGKAVLFFSYGPDYGLDHYAIHGSCPLQRGHKAIFQRWMRFGENNLFAKADEALQKERTLWGHDRLLQPALSETTTVTTTTPAPSVAAEGAGVEIDAVTPEL